MFGTEEGFGSDETFGRIRNLQYYLERCTSKGIAPTAKGAFFAIYPRLKIFYQVLQRMEDNPYQNFLYILEKGVLRKRSLEEIIDNAEKRKMATPEELEEMRKNLALLKKIGTFALDAILTQDA